MSRVVIVGGVAGGMSAATRLRRLDEHADITVVERGEHVSFANCGLPYHLGGVIERREDLLVQTPQSLRARYGIDVRTRTEARAIDRTGHTLAVRDLATGRDEVLPYDQLILAPGARPIRPDLPGIERALTLRSLSDMDAIEDRLVPLAGSARPAVVLGGGFVGLEVAENLHRRGLSVTVVEAAPQIMAPLDVELAQLVHEHLERNGVRVITGVAADAIGTDHVKLANGSALPADLVIAAVGVQPESDLAQAAGLACGPRGVILVDDQQRTSDADIFAVGDAAAKSDAIDGEPAFVPLAQTANRHGRLVADVIAGRDVTAVPGLGTAIVGLFGLQAATTGWNERRARAAGRNITVIHTHPLDHAGYYPGAQKMSLKLVFDGDTGEIVGAQGVGPAGVDKRVDVIATAMRGGLRATDLADLELAYAPQFGSAKDPVVVLGMIADNLENGEQTRQWHEVADALAAGSQLVDVRTAAEFEGGSIPGAINIPVDELRERAGEIPDGPVILCCAVGQRGHTATRILAQLGRDTANLDGGYTTWRAGASATAADEPSDAKQ